MGFGGISFWQLLIVLLIIVLIFGTRRLKGVGSDLGQAIRNFRQHLKEEDDFSKENTTTPEHVDNKQLHKNTK